MNINEQQRCTVKTLHGRGAAGALERARDGKRGNATSVAHDNTLMHEVLMVLKAQPHQDERREPLDVAARGTVVVQAHTDRHQ